MDTVSELRWKSWTYYDDGDCVFSLSYYLSLNELWIHFFNCLFCFNNQFCQKEILRRQQQPSSSSSSLYCNPHHHHVIVANFKYNSIIIKKNATTTATNIMNNYYIAIIFIANNDDDDDNHYCKIFQVRFFLLINHFVWVNLMVMMFVCVFFYYVKFFIVGFLFKIYESIMIGHW